MAVNVTTNKKESVKDVNTSIISLWRKVNRDLDDFRSKKAGVEEDLDSLEVYVKETYSKLLTIKTNISTLYSILNQLVGYLK